MDRRFLYALLMVGGFILYRVLGQRLRLHRVKRAWAAGNAALKEGRPEQAEAAFRRCVALMPIWKLGRTMLAVSLVQQNRLDEAEEQFRFVADLEPRQADGHLSLALFYAIHRQQDSAKAIASLRTAIACDPAIEAKLAADPRLSGLYARLQAEDATAN